MWLSPSPWIGRGGGGEGRQRDLVADEPDVASIEGATVTAEHNNPEADSRYRSGDSAGLDGREPHAFGFDTRAIHAGQRPDPYTGARAVPIFQTTSYVFEDPESAAAYFNLQEYGNTYSRIMNPTTAVFEERIASLEGGAGAVAFASGLAAQAAALFTMLTPGDHVISSSALYGGTITQLKHLARKLSIEVTFVDPDKLENWRAAVKPNTKV